MQPRTSLRSLQSPAVEVIHMVLGTPIAGAYYYYHIASVGLSIFTIPS